MAADHPARQAFFDALEAKYDRMVRHSVAGGCTAWVAAESASNEIFRLVFKMLNEDVDVLADQEDVA